MHALKRQLRAAFPRVFRLMAAAWRSPPVAYLFHAQRRQRMRRFLRSGRRVFGFDVSGTMGLGATLSNAVTLLGFCDQQGLTPRIRFTNPLYRTSGSMDWFPSYFEVKRSAGVVSPQEAKSIRYLHVGSHFDYNLPGVDLNITLPRAHAVFHKYIALDRSLIDEADAFAAANGLDQGSIGVHFRGTDKTTDKTREAPSVEWETLFSTLRLLAASAPRAKILFATDEPDLIDYARRSDLGARLVIYECREIFSGGRAAHITDGDGYRRGFEALVTILLLAKCGVIIRTPSHLSAWANILNLDQKVVMLSKPFDDFMQFPDAEVWEQRWDPQRLAEFMREGVRFQAC